MAENRINRELDTREKKVRKKLGRAQRLYRLLFPKTAMRIVGFV
jgi:hypothetical protein